MSGTPVQASCKRSISETVWLPTVRADVRQQHVAFKYIEATKYPPFTPSSSRSSHRKRQHKLVDLPVH